MTKQDIPNTEGITPPWKRALEAAEAAAADGNVPSIYDPEKALAISWKTYEEGANSLRTFLRTKEPLSKATMPPEILHALEERGMEIDKDEDWRIRQVITTVAKLLEARGKQSYPWPAGENSGLTGMVRGSAGTQGSRDKHGRDLS